MSDTTPTALQPAHALSNVTAHPGSSWAGASVALATLGNAASNGLPTNAAGWAAFGLALLTSVLAGLGK